MSADQYNIDLANRQIEINEWSYHNKMDTLFVFQILFMAILFIGILMGFKRVNLINVTFIWYAFLVLTLLVVIIIINRSMYTNNRRNTRSWNKRRFDDDNTKESPLGRGDTSYQTYLETVKATYGTSETTGTSGTSNCACK